MLNQSMTLKQLRLVQVQKNIYCNDLWSDTAPPVIRAHNCCRVMLLTSNAGDQLPAASRCCSIPMYEWINKMKKFNNHNLWRGFDYKTKTIRNNISFFSCIIISSPPSTNSLKNGMTASGMALGHPPPFLEKINYKTKTIRNRISFFWLHNHIIIPLH